MAGSKTIVASNASRAMRRSGSNYITQHNYATADDLSTTLYIQQWSIGGGEYLIWRLALIFDTSDIPAGAKILTAIIQVKPNAAGVVDKNWSVVIRNGQATYPHNPVVVGDYLYSHYSGDGGSIAVSSITDGVWNNITMNSTGRDWVQQAGTTKLVLINSKDISSTAPSALERVYFSRTNCRLVITYSIEPTVTVQAPSSVLTTSATANGNITDTGGENCTVRGFEYGLTQVATWEEHDDGDFSSGTFTKALTGLLANTAYWIRAYTTNPQDTVYSEWLQFQTAASGVIPAGTLIVICSDYTGYTYKAQKAETDDGEAYIAYFVFSTDLSNKKALAYYKRILDLYLYFNSEDSGTAEVYVKRDSEASWYYVGSVSLAGTADIIVKHLATRLHAKHFLFKIQAANAFDFLGCLFEFLPGGMR